MATGRALTGAWSAEQRRALGSQLLSLPTPLAQSFEQLEPARDTLTDGTWAHEGIMTAGPRTMVEIVGHHLRNVETQSVDLDIGYRPSDRPALFVETELPERLAALPRRADDAELLA